MEAGVDGEQDKMKPVMLFCHGFPEFWFVWRHQMKYFKNKYRVIAIDNRGYGESEKPTELEKYHVKVIMITDLIIYFFDHRRSWLMISKLWSPVLVLRYIKINKRSRQ